MDDQTAPESGPKARPTLEEQLAGMTDEEIEAMVDEALEKASRNPTPLTDPKLIKAAEELRAIFDGPSSGS